MITRRTIKKVRRIQVMPAGTRVMCVTGRTLLRHQYDQWAKTNVNTKSIDKRLGRQRRPRVSLIISVLLHVLAFVMMNIRLPEWYRPPPIPEPIVMAPIELVDIPRFHISSARKMVTAAPQNRKPPRPTIDHTPTQSRPAADRVKQIAQLTPLASQTLNTDAKLALSDTLLSNHTRMEPLLEESSGTPTGILTHSPQAREVEIKRSSSQPTDEQPEEMAENTPPASREEQIGTALEGIADSIASGTSTLPVDIVFLLDSSGSMEDNIRAVGGQLRRMVQVFQEKEVNFTLGIITFKYLDRDTIVFPQTRDYAKYEYLLESHVIQRGGDERAYDAIVKSIQRVKFRSNADRRFVLVTDEATKGSYPITEVLSQCRSAGIKLDVIGVDRTLDKALAVQTGGLWFPIPGGG